MLVKSTPKMTKTGLTTKPRHREVNMWERYRLRKTTMRLRSVKLSRRFRRVLVNSFVRQGLQQRWIRKVQSLMVSTAYDTFQQMSKIPEMMELKRFLRKELNCVLHLHLKYVLRENIRAQLLTMIYLYQTLRNQGILAQPRL